MILLIALFFRPALFSEEKAEDLCQQLAQIEKIDRDLTYRFPSTFTRTGSSGLLNTPSASIQKTGSMSVVSFYGHSPSCYGINMAISDQIELAGLYSTSKKILEGKWVFLEKDAIPYAPSCAVGMRGVFDPDPKSSFYLVLTKNFSRHAELSLGLDKHFFGALKVNVPSLPSFMFIATKKASEKAEFGLAYSFRDLMRLTISHASKEKLRFMAALSFPFGSARSFFPKTEAAMPAEKKKEAFVIRDVKQFYIAFENKKFHREEEMKAYLKEFLDSKNGPFFRARLFSHGLACQDYLYPSGAREAVLGSFGRPDKSLFFNGVSLLPRLLTFFGGKDGRFKADFGLIGHTSFELPLDLFCDFSYSVPFFSSKAEKDKKKVVRRDAPNFYYNSYGTLETLYIQKGWNLGKDRFFRLAAGLFEPAFGGCAAEGLILKEDYGWGVSYAFLKKQRAHRLLQSTFSLSQAFLDFYSFPKNLKGFEGRLRGGKFLAGDLGARIDLARYFDNGARFGIWYTRTNSKEKIAHKAYHDKGFSFSFPLDVFSKGYSKENVAYATSLFLRDSGSIAETGKTLYETIAQTRR